MGIKVQFHNVPNFYCSYYIYGLSLIARDISYDPRPEFKKYNFQPIIICSIDDNLIVIDNDDPQGIDQDLYGKSLLYFATNKLIDSPEYSQDKIKALYPHYPINIHLLYFTIFKSAIEPIKRIPEFMVNLRRLRNRPEYTRHKPTAPQGNYVFFASSIWKREHTCNMQREQFILHCMNRKDIQFEGGFRPRTVDDFHKNYDVNTLAKKYSTTTFTKKSQQSLFTFNNPAVRGAISWRVGELLNSGTPLLSFPLKTELPTPLINRQHIHQVSKTEDYEEAISELVQSAEYRAYLSTESKAYFNSYCTPLSQAKYIFRSLDALHQESIKAEPLNSPNSN